MPDMITRCPKCATAFRISDSLLRSAKGMVRCGSCLNVFNASEHLESKPAPQVAKPNPSGTQPASASLTSTIGPATKANAPQGKTDPTRTPPPKLPADATVQDAPKPGAAGVKEPSFTHETIKPLSNPISISGFLKQEENTPSTTSRDLFERPWSAQDVRQRKEEPEPDADESWALELLNDDSDEASTSKPAKPELRATTTTREDFEIAVPKAASDLAKSEPQPTPKLKPLPEPVAEIADHTESVKQNLTETKSVAVKDKTSSSAAPLAELESPQEKPTYEAPIAEPKEVLEKHSSNKTRSGDKKSKSILAEPKGLTSTAETPVARPLNPLHDVIAAIEPEPLEVDWRPQTSWTKRLLWPVLVAIALISLLAQVAWLEYHRLNRIEPYRSFYAVACRYLQCTLPELIDRSAIKTYNLVVRSHPEVEKALMVDVILQNNARFEQTFPNLVLTFSNLRNEPVASRKLTPAEYLGGELAGATTMPVKQPIHIGLEVVDPGEEAVSYSIAISD